MSQVFTEVFHNLPLAYVLGRKVRGATVPARSQAESEKEAATMMGPPWQVFVVHGGLFSRDDVTLEELRKIDRCREPPDEGDYETTRELRTNYALPTNDRPLPLPGAAG